MATGANRGGGESRTVKRVTRKKAAIESTTAEQAAEEIIVRPSEDPGIIGKPKLRGGVRESDVTNFLRQLIMLLEAGTPILRGLKTLSGRGQRAGIRGLVADIAAYVEAGNPLWQAFDRHPRYFDSVFVNLIRASEASGTLVVVLRRTVDYRVKRELLRKRVKGAMIYPILLIVACFGVLVLLTTLVIPQFEEMFEQAGIIDKVPWITKVLIAASHQWVVMLTVPIAVVFAFWLVYSQWYVRNPLRRMKADRLKLKIPIVGKILHKSALVQLSRSMSLLLRSGLSMMATLELTRKAIHNLAVAQTLQDIRDSVERGEGMEPSLRRNAHLIPPVVTDMLVTGEESGRVDQICDQIAEVYEEEVKIAVNTLGETIQPIFTVVFGFIVVVLFIALFLPLVSMIESISAASA